MKTMTLFGAALVVSAHAFAICPSDKPFPAYDVNESDPVKMEHCYRTVSEATSATERFLGVDLDDIDLPRTGETQDEYFSRVENSSPGNREISTPNNRPEDAGGVYDFTCPSGTSASIPRPPSSSIQCTAAFERYAKVMSCNLIDDMASAEQQYYSACADDIFRE